MDEHEIEILRRMSRRNFLKRSAGVGAGIVAVGAVPTILAACSTSATAAPTAAHTAASTAAARALRIASHVLPSTCAALPVFPCR